MKNDDLSEVEQLLAWSSAQAAILTGGGILQHNSSCGDEINADSSGGKVQHAPGSTRQKRFLSSELPHHLLRQKISWRVFGAWHQQGRRSHLLVGAWRRPLFSGGWQHSTETDTYAFNLQSPSYFIDMRIPRLRDKFVQTKSLRTLSACSWYELRLLARQHCFAGYTFPEIQQPGCAPVYTRHHVIDWNYNPLAPRNRPNRWWVQLHNATDKGTFYDGFKEHSVVRDEEGVPVYMERWQRMPHLQLPQRNSYLVLRKQRPCPVERSRNGDVVQWWERRDAMIVVVDGYFLLSLDRDYNSLDRYAAQNPNSALHSAASGGAAVVDALWQDYKHHGDCLAKTVAEEYLSLEGSFGTIFSEADQSDFIPNWRVIISTIPWLQDRDFMELFEFSLHQTTGDKHSNLGIVNINVRRHNDDDSARLRCLTGGWAILECSYSTEELSILLSCRSNKTIGTRRNSLQSKL